MRPHPCWTPQSAWRRQKSRECTAHQPHLSRGSICCTPDRCRTTTPCCLLPAWRTTVPVRTVFISHSVCVSVCVCSCILKRRKTPHVLWVTVSSWLFSRTIDLFITVVIIVIRQKMLSRVLLVIAPCYIAVFDIFAVQSSKSSLKFPHHIYICDPSVW